MGEGALAGRVVVLTGASSGIGSALALGLAKRGARMVLAARRADRLQAVAEGLDDCLPVTCDITSDGDRRRLVEATIEHFGQIDGLINNAGTSFVKPALTEPVEEFTRIIDINLIAPFALAQLVANEMKHRGGSIINISSIAGFRATPLPTAGYTAAKAGILGLTRELATQWARYAIRVNAVAPGWFETELTGALFKDGTPPDWMSGTTPLGRPGAPGELDGAMTFLLSDESSFVTGHTLVVDGGLTAT